MNSSQTGARSGVALSRASYSMIFIIAGAVLGLVGLLGATIPGLNASLKKSIYDLPILVVFVGVILLLRGGIQFFRRARLSSEVVISGRTATQFFFNNAIIIALLVLVGVICFIQPMFMQVTVVLDIFKLASPRLVIALGICFSLIIAGTDLSAGRMVGLSAVIVGSMLQNPDYGHLFFGNYMDISVIWPILIAIGACVCFGLISGFLVAQFKMHPFIATLAVQVMVYGAASLYFDMSPNNSQPIGGIRPDFSSIGQARIFEGLFGLQPDFKGISILVPIALFFCVLIWFVLNKTVFGKNVYAIGGNREAAVVSGVNVYVTILTIFVIGAAMYGIGGVLEAARTAGATNNYGNGYELDAIAACVVGGVSLNGGIGKVGGIVSGVLIFSVIQYGLQFISLSPMWQQIIKGAIIAIAVAIDMSKYNKK
ncbi:MAG: beta-methylgalactoside transporter permease [Oscillospiraceae bacterium]|jgi:methyl-galactoside transport system permease protein|nr:beta-methylgalactoside transporter permease [Oscillospiraceae bacterium]